jgi:hypothetical protein
MRWIELLVTLMDNLDLNKGRGRFLHFFLAVSANKSWLNSVYGVNLVNVPGFYWLVVFERFFCSWRFFPLAGRFGKSTPNSRKSESLAES